MRSTLLNAAAFAALCGFPHSAHAVPNLLTNGSFSTGDFTGWSVSNVGTEYSSFNIPATTELYIMQGWTLWPYTITAFGGGSAFTPYVTQFDFGLGDQNAAKAQVGITSGGGYFGGISLSQSFYAVGLLNFSALIASVGGGLNGDYGHFSVLIDGLPVAGYGSGFPFGGPGINWLVGSASVTAGMHDLAIDITRGSYYSTGDYETPLQYISDIVVSGSGGTAVSVPEPTSIAILGAGLLGLVVVRPRSR